MIALRTVQFGNVFRVVEQFILKADHQGSDAFSTQQAKLVVTIVINISSVRERRLLFERCDGRWEHRNAKLLVDSAIVCEIA